MSYANRCLTPARVRWCVPSPAPVCPLGLLGASGPGLGVVVGGVVGVGGAGGPVGVGGGAGRPSGMARWAHRQPSSQPGPAWVAQTRSSEKRACTWPRPSEVKGMAPR